VYNVDSHGRILLGEHPMAGECACVESSCWVEGHQLSTLQGSARGGINMAELIRVAAQSKSTAVAGAIAGVVREAGHAEIQAIGAGAVNQALKAAAIARGFLLLDGIDVVCIPSFVDVEIDGIERTAIRLTIEPRGQ
jgi:stage V sporulation protein S